MGKYIVLLDSSEKRSAEDSARSFGAHWARLGDQTVVWTASEEWNAFTNKAKQAGINLDQQEGAEMEGQLYLVIQTGSSFLNTYPDVRIVIDKGRYLVVDLLPEKVCSFSESKDDWWTMRPLPMDRVIMDIIKPVALAATPSIQANIEAVSQSTYSSYLISLVNFLTRYSLSSQFTNAAEWAVDKLKSFGYQTDLRPINVGMATAIIS